MVRYIVTTHAIRLGVDPEVAYYHAILFSVLTGLIENSGKLSGGNPISSAKGLYQFLSGSVTPALNRLKRMVKREPWMDEVEVHKDTGRLTWDQQTALFLADILEKRGTDALMRDVLGTGSPSSMLSVYEKFHHTNPDKNTTERARRYFYGT